MGNATIPYGPVTAERGGHGVGDVASTRRISDRDESGSGTGDGGTPRARRACCVDRRIGTGNEREPKTNVQSVTEAEAEQGTVAGRERARQRGEGTEVVHGVAQRDAFRQRCARLSRLELEAWCRERETDLF